MTNKYNKRKKEEREGKSYGRRKKKGTGRKSGSGFYKAAPGQQDVYSGLYAGNPAGAPEQRAADGIGGHRMTVEGEFNAQRFFETLALIISQREGVKVTVTVTQPEPEEKKQQSA